MQRFNRSSRWARSAVPALMMAGAVGWVAVIASHADLPGSQVTQEQVVRGRFLVVTHDCGGCHSGGNGSNPGIGLGGASRGIGTSGAGTGAYSIQGNGLPAGASSLPSVGDATR